MQVYIKTIANRLGLDVTDSDMFMMIGEELASITNLQEFAEYVKENRKNTKYQYDTAFIKLEELAKDFKNQQVALCEVEQLQVYRFTDALLKKLTWYFDELAWLNITEKQLETQEWRTFENVMGEKFFTEKELVVCDHLGSNFNIFQLATRRKPELEQKLRDIVKGLVIKKKEKAIALAYKTQNRKQLAMSRGVA